jgi:hypothetical protein
MPDWLGPGPLDAATLNSNGFGVIKMSHNKPNIVWIVEQITPFVGPTSTAGQVGVFKNGNPVGPSAILSPMTTPAGVAGISQTFAGDPYVPLQASDEIEIVVSGATSGDGFHVRAQYREYPLSDPAVDGVLGGF